MGLQGVSSAASVHKPAAAPHDSERVEAALAALRGITDAVSGEADLESLLELVAERAAELVSVDRCAIYLLDEETGLYRGHLLRARGANDDRITCLTCGDDADRFTGEILATRAPVVIADARRDRRPVRAVMRSLNVRSVVGVPMVLRGSVLGIMYLDVEGSRRRFSDQDVHVAALFANLTAIVIANARATSRLRTLVAKGARQNAALRRAAIAENRLAELVLDGADLDEIAASVAALTGRPCAIYGADGRRIGAGAPPGDSGAPALLEPEHSARPAIAEALSGLRPGTTSVVGPFRGAGLTHRLLISPVAVGGDEWGRLILMERGTRLTAFDAQVARRAATIVALEISAWRRAGELATGGETLVRELMAGAGTDDTLPLRARREGLDVDDQHVVCLLSAADGEPWSGPDAGAVALSLGEVAPAVGTLMPEGLALVIRLRSGPGDPATLVRARVEEVLAAMRPAYDAIGAVSAAFTGLAGYRPAYQEARQVIRCLRTFRRGGGRQVLAADELGAGRLFLASTTREDADAFVRQTLGPLLDTDERSMSDLLATLEVFFSSSRSVREAADHVGVHENTIRYRLARIAELTGLDVATNADDQLAGQLATLVLRLEGVLHPSPGMVQNAA